MENEANFLKQPLPKPCAQFSLHRRWLCTIKTACTPSSAVQVWEVSPQVCRKWLFSQPLGCHPLNLVLQKGFPNPLTPFCHSCEPLVGLLHCTGFYLHCVHPPQLLGSCQRAKKESSCCQTQRWTETSPHPWKVLGKVTHSSNTCVVGSLCWILWICPSEITQQHTCTI